MVDGCYESYGLWVMSDELPVQTQDRGYLSIIFKNDRELPELTIIHHS
jgi:hypothetical protein